MDADIRVDARLTDAGSLDGMDVTVLVDPEDAIKELTPKQIVAAFEGLLDDNNREAEALAEKIAADWAEDEPEPDEPEEDELFRPLSDWDRDTLRRAIAQDDGRRVIDLLKVRA